MGWASRHKRELRAHKATPSIAIAATLEEAHELSTPPVERDAHPDVLIVTRKSMRLLLDVFLGVWKASAPRIFANYGGGHCHLATRYAADVLRTIGFSAEPMSVFVEAERLDNPGVCVGISPSILVPNAGGWYGHLVLIVGAQCDLTGHAPQWIVDVTPGQFRSPHDGIEAPPALMGDWTEHPVKETRTQLLVPRLNMQITYWRRRDDDGSWRASWEGYDFTGNDRKNIDALVEATRTEFRRHAKFSR